jgi:hypothetical protein
VGCSLPGIIKSVSKVDESLPPKDSKENSIETTSKPGSWNRQQIRPRSSHDVDVVPKNTSPKATQNEIPYAPLFEQAQDPTHPLLHYSFDFLLDCMSPMRLSEF